VAGFGFKSGQKGQKSGHYAHFLYVEKKLYFRKVSICPLFLGICPLLKTKVGSEKPSIYAGLRVFCPLSHFFLLLNAK